jgi:hypothetical protein
MLPMRRRGGVLGKSGCDQYKIKRRTSQEGYIHGKTGTTNRGRRKGSSDQG